MALDIYKLTREWFDWSFENPETVHPNHCALYFFMLEHCNRLGWKEKFGLPTGMAKEAIGIKSYKTYINTLNDLVEWGFVKMLEKSKNQFSSNIVALVNNTKARTKALDKAMLKHIPKHRQSSTQSDSQSSDSIIIHSTDIHSTNIPTGTPETETDDNGESGNDDMRKFEVFKKWIDDNAPTVNKMASPFTFEEYLKIRDEIPDKDQLKDLLQKMHNWVPLLKKNKSAYLTTKNWNKNPINQISPKRRNSVVVC